MRVTLRLLPLAAALATVPIGHVARAQTAQLATSATVVARPDGVDVRRGPLLIRVTALSEAVLRVRIARDGTLPEDASWAVPADVRARSVRVMARADGFATAALRVSIAPDLRMTVRDSAGRVIVADDADPIRLDGRGFALRKALPIGEHVFALGDKTGGTLDRRGSSYVDWNTDAYAFTSATDPIYKSIPFFVGVDDAGASYGVFLDNSWRGWFDFGHKEAEVASFGADDGPIDYYLIAGPALRDVVRRYTDLTGKAPLAPLWSLGYQQSRYSYMNAGEVRDVIGTLRRDRIPTDVVWLDIDLQDRNRPFTVDRTAFRDLKGLTGDLAKNGVRLVAITDLHVAAAPGQGYAPYDTGIKGDHFVHRPDGSVYVGEVWPGPAVFPDFTDPAARRWWGTNYRSFVDDGVSGFWNDMNEPSVFKTPSLTMPLDTVHRVAGDGFAARTATHAEIHNVFGLENTRATYDGLLTLRPDERPFVMTRASYAGGQRYSVTWTGDNSATWDHLKLSIHQLVNLGLSGFGYAGADVGGFTGGPSAELLTRWFEIGAFTPVFRDHAAKGTPRAEPWVDGPDQLAIRRRYVEARYRLMPYLYDLADRNARTGDPLMRAPFYDYPALLGPAAPTSTCDQAMTFTLGAALLIAPPPHPESPQEYGVCLPSGGWFDLWTGRAASPTGGGGGAVDVVRETPRLDRLPVFVRAGTILPSQPLVQSTAQTPSGPLTLDVYSGAAGAPCSGSIYLDDGHSLAFQRGRYLRQTFACEISASGRMRIRLGRREGGFAPWWRSYTIVVHGWSGAAAVTVEGRTLPAQFDAVAATLRFVVPDRPAETTIDIAAR